MLFFCREICYNSVCTKRQRLALRKMGKYYEENQEYNEEK